jgi:hypothetical protein
MSRSKEGVQNTWRWPGRSIQLDECGKLERFARMNPATFEKIHELLGLILMRLPIIAHHVGHRNPMSTLFDYVRPGAYEDEATRFAVQFLIDLLSMKTDAIIQKWYGQGPLSEPEPEPEPAPSEPSEPLPEGFVRFRIPDDFKASAPTSTPFKLKRRAPKRQKLKKRSPPKRRERPQVVTAYCSECLDQGGMRYRSVRDGLCALHLSRQARAAALSEDER